MFSIVLCIAAVVSADDDSLSNDMVHCGKFKWHPVIIAVLQQAPNKQLPVKKLRKKVTRSMLL